MVTEALSVEYVCFHCLCVGLIVINQQTKMLYKTLVTTLRTFPFLIPLRLGCAGHKQSILNKPAFNELHNNHSNVYKLLVNASLSNEIFTTNQNHFVMEFFFRVIHFTVTKNWSYTQNFKDVIQLIINCGGN